jgi:hypothetical protein
MVDTKHLNHVEENVRVLPKCDEHFRNCDICLIFNYWMSVDSEVRFMSVEGRHCLTSSESIRRSRQRIQSKEWTDKDGVRRYGMYLPTDPEVRKKRGIAEEVYKQWSQE